MSAGKGHECSLHIAIVGAGDFSLADLLTHYNAEVDTSWI